MKIKELVLKANTNIFSVLHFYRAQQFVPIGSDYFLFLVTARVRGEEMRMMRWKD